MNLCIFLLHIIFLFKDGKVTVEPGEWLLWRLEGVKVMLCTTHSLLVGRCCLVQSRNPIPHSGEKYRSITGRKNISFLSLLYLHYSVGKKKKKQTLNVNEILFYMPLLPVSLLFLCWALVAGSIHHPLFSQ